LGDVKHIVVACIFSVLPFGVINDNNSVVVIVADLPLVVGRVFHFRPIYCPVWQQVVLHTHVSLLKRNFSREVLNIFIHQHKLVATNENKQ